MEISLMKKILYILSTIVLAVCAFTACQEPDALIPAESRNGINSVTAYFLYDDREENEFPAEIDYEAGLITIVFPYTYPANSDSHLEMSDLKKVKVVANLDDNVVVDPPLLMLDLTRDDNFVTVTDQRKQKKTYQIIGVIRKSNLCQITKFELPSKNLTGVINESTKAISLIYNDVIGSVLAKATLSFGASFQGVDPTVTKCNYDSPVDLTVVAQDGVTTATYTVKIEEPDILSKGMRHGSEKMLWHINLNSLGIGNSLLTGGFAALKDYVVLNTRGEDMVVINAETGKKTGTIALDFKENLKNFYCTADLNDNILVCNLTPNDGNVFTVYRIQGINGTPTKYIEFDAGGESLGRKISVYGSLDGDAIITATITTGSVALTDNSFYRWTVTGGVLNPVPVKVTIADDGVGLWTYNSDIVYSSATDTDADYFVSSYAAIGGTDGRHHLWMDGKTHMIKFKSPAFSVNWVPNAVDYAFFNGVGIMASITINGFTWGADDVGYLYDLSENNLDEPVWQCEKGVYGAFATNAVANGNQTGDVALRVSPDGYFLYFYYMFSGGQIVKVQFDCLNM